jgi:membrane protease YdiL (CAAX protease family)
MGNQVPNGKEDSAPPQSPIIAQSPETDPDSEPRWKVIPGWEYLLALLRLFFWLGSAAYIADVPQRWQLVLLPLWILAFLWRYVFRGEANPAKRNELVRERNQLGLGLPPVIAPDVVVLCLLVVVSAPWWGAWFTLACGRPEWFQSMWPADKSMYFGITSDSLLLLLLWTSTFPLVEEFVFRGWMLVPLRRRVGSHWAVFLPAIVFTFFHLDPHPGMLTSHFLLGVILGYTVVSTGSIWPGVAMHYLANLMISLGRRPPLHDSMANAFRSPVFRCRPSLLIVLLSLGAFGGTLVLANRARQKSLTVSTDSSTG